MSATQGYRFEDITVGMSDEFSKTVTEADIVSFADVSGDHNPVHMDEEFAKTTMFKGRIAHGMLSAGFISTVLGTKLPGPGSIYVAQNLKFKAPVRIGDTVTAKVTVTNLVEAKKFVEFETVCYVNDKPVITGTATMMIPASR